MSARVRNVAIIGAVVVATLIANSAMAIPLFSGEANRLIGDARRGTDEDYVNTGAYNYLSPANLLNGAPVLPGSVAGHTESIALGGVAGGSTAINIPQAMVIPAGGNPNPAFGGNGVTGPLVDSRAGLFNPVSALSNFNPFAFGARAGAGVQWQTIQDGSSVALTPFGSVAGQASNLTPQFTQLAVLGQNGAGQFVQAPLQYTGGAPGSSALDVLPDSVPWLRDPQSPGSVVTGFGLTPWDTRKIDASYGGALGGFYAQAMASLQGRINVYENNTLYDQVAGPQNENNFDHNGGTINQLAPGTYPGDQLDKAVDGTLLLAGTLEDVTIVNTWRAPLKAQLPGADGILNTADDVFVADATKVRRTITINGTVWFQKFDQNGNISALWDLLGNKQVETLAGPDGILGTADDISLEVSVGSFSASWTNIPFSNTTGTDFNGAYDFIGDTITSYSSDLTFFVAIPEPLTMFSSVLALAGIGGYLRRRRAVVA